MHTSQKIGPDYLSDLPEEILITILSLLTTGPLFNMALTSRLFHRLFNDELIWEKKFQQYFPVLYSDASTHSCKNWRTLFIDNFFAKFMYYEDEEMQFIHLVAGGNLPKLKQLKTIDYIFQNKKVHVEDDDNTPLSISREIAVAQSNQEILNFLYDTVKENKSRLNITDMRTLTFGIFFHQTVDELCDLLSNKDDVEKLKIYSTSLVLAARFGHYKLVKYLAETCKIDINQTDEFGQTALLCAAVNGHDAILTYLIGKDASLEHYTINHSKIRGNGLTALGWATQNGKLSAVKILFNAKAKLDFPYRQTWSSQSAKDAFDLAAEHNQAEVFKFLIEATNTSNDDLYDRLFEKYIPGIKLRFSELCIDRLNKTCTDAEMMTLIERGCSLHHGDIDIAIYILRTRKNWEHSSLIQFILSFIRKDAKRLHFFFEEVLSLITKPHYEKDSNTIIHHAANEGNADLLNLFLDKYPNYIDNIHNDKTALTFAIENHHFECATILFTRDAKLKVDNISLFDTVLEKYLKDEQNRGYYRKIISLFLTNEKSIGHLNPMFMEDNSVPIEMRLLLKVALYIHSIKSNKNEMDEQNYEICFDVSSQLKNCLLSNSDDNKPKITPELVSSLDKIRENELLNIIKTMLECEIIQLTESFPLVELSSHDIERKKIGYLNHDSVQTFNFFYSNNLVDETHPLNQQSIPILSKEDQPPQLN